MLGTFLNSRPSSPSTTPRRALRPSPEALEGRFLLYSTLGAQWAYGSRISYSFMPDGTNVGGTPSALFQTLNARFPTATWQQQFQQAAALWENVTGINLALVPDNGAPLGTSGDQQGDSRFGDIRIGAIPLPAGTLAMAFLPPPINGGPDAGDILFNSTVNWQIGSNYDLMTVATHEIGHALGMAHSSISTATMSGGYNGLKQALTSDDIAGIQSVYGIRQPDVFGSNGSNNNTYLSATNITPWIDGNAQIALPGLDLTTSSDVDWYIVTVPRSTTGTMTVTVQSSNLSSLAPKLQVYNASLGLLGQVSAPLTFGATISYTVSGLQTGQSYYFKVMAAGGPAPIGGYGLLVNFGSKVQPPIPPPNTVVAEQPDQGGGTLNSGAGTLSDSTGKRIPGSAATGAPGQPGDNGKGNSRNAPGYSRRGGPDDGSNRGDDSEVDRGEWTTIGNLRGWTDSLTVSLSAWRTPVRIAFAVRGSASLPGSHTQAIGVLPDLSPVVPTQSLVGFGDQSNLPTQSRRPLPPGSRPAVFQAVDSVLAAWTHGRGPRSI